MLVLGPVSLFYDEQVPLSERRRLFQDLVRLLARIKTGSALLLLQPRLPRAAANQHFGRLLAPVIDYFVEVESPGGPPPGDPPGISGGLGAPGGPVMGRRRSRRPLPTSKRRPLTWTYRYPNAHTCSPT